MNTKTNRDYTSNSYNGGIMGSDSPAALLDMLAEVASQTLHSEKKRTKSLLASQCKPKTDIVKRKTQEALFNVPQLLSMPASQLVKQFSIFTSDELKRQYSYTCALVTGCGQKYTSFASEGRARMSIKAHLADHLEYLKTNIEAYNTFTAKSVNCRNHKTNSHSKKNRLQQSKKPQETLNKENKNVVLEKSTNYLRNILLNDSSCKELEKHKTIEKTGNPRKLQSSEEKDADRVDFKVLGDHSYFERLKDEIPNGKEVSSVNVLNSSIGDQNIVFMVVGTDSVHMKEYTHIKQDIPETLNKSLPAVYLPGIPWTDESGSKNTEAATTTKPKGKAKFIGTSKEEREMALAFMDRIKKKGNPAGNNLECRICNPPRSFTAPTTLVSHYRSHAGIKPYECRICRSVFTRRHSLKYHMLIHQNQTRFTCADCGKKFRHPSHFREHRRRHTGEAPFGCDDCGQRFKTRNTYKRHLKTRHGKVLTTTGELLYLSEEDFQKVRTNKKKRSELHKEQPVDEDAIASKSISYHDNHSPQEITETSTEEYIMTKSSDPDSGDWESEEARTIIRRQIEAYDESLLYKTETIETEIPVDSIISDKNGNNIPERYTEKIEDNLSELQNASYDRLETIPGPREIAENDNIGDESTLVYNDIDGTSSYIRVQYTQNDNSAEDASNIVEYEENGDFLQNHITNQIQVIQQSEDGYAEDIVYDENGESVVRYVVHYAEEIQADEIGREDQEDKRRNNKCNEELIIKRNYDGSRCAELLDNKYQERELILPMNAENIMKEKVILQTVDEISQDDLLQTNETMQGQCIIDGTKIDEQLGSYQSVVAELLDDTVLNEENRYLLSSQTKQCVGMFSQRLSTAKEQQSKSKVQPSKEKRLKQSA